MLEKIKKIFRSGTSRNGSYSVGMIALVIAIAVVINLIAGQLPESIRSIDVSDNKIYEISDTTKDLLKKLDQKISFQVFAEKDSTDERIKTFLKKYAELSDNIEVEWIDPVLHPSELTENNVDSDTILITSEKTGKSTSVSFGDILVYDEYSYYMTGSVSATEFDGEGQLTSAVNYVTSDTIKKIYYTTGHGENTFSTSVSDLLGKNNMAEEELNLMMQGEIPEDCDLLFLYAPMKDITEDEKTLIENYMSKGGDVFLMLGETDDATPNLDTLLEEYGMECEDGYIADMQRCYQGNYYYIFPQINGSEEMMKGMSSGMVLLVNAHGFHVTDPARETITVTSFMTTSSEAYAVTEDEEKQGTYTLGAVAVESVVAEDEEDSEETNKEKDMESCLTVISADSMIDAQITDSFSTLENLDLFMNALSANFDDVQNVAIEPKSLEVTYNTMQHAGIISLLVIFGISLIILVFGFVRWWKRRKA